MAGVPGVQTKGLRLIHMPQPNEALLQFIWEHKLWLALPFYTNSGKELFVINPGQRNTESGPDFFNARIRLNGLILQGNIELHVKSSDWLKHGHQLDARYNALILHVVYEHDVEVPQNTAYGVEVLEMKPYIAPGALERYAAMQAEQRHIPCHQQMSGLPEEPVRLWLNRLLADRMEERAAFIEQVWQYEQASSPQVMFTLLLKAFGFNSNATGFELLARHLPLAVLLRHRNALQDIEALLLGMVGALEQESSDDYTQVLKTDFERLKVLYNLIPMPTHLLRTGAVRPHNSPYLRLMQFAALVHRYPFVFTEPLSERTRRFFLETTFPLHAAPYWEWHSAPGRKRNRKLNVTLSAESRYQIAVNAWIPFLFFEGKRANNTLLMEYAMDLTVTLPFENNRKTIAFDNLNLTRPSAADSQAFIQLHDQFCIKKACLRCAIGLKILRKDVYLSK